MQSAVCFCCLSDNNNISSLHCNPACSHAYCSDCLAKIVKIQSTCLYPQCETDLPQLPLLHNVLEESK